MKKLILIAICFISLQLFAQGNLQFNQVLNSSYDFNTSYYSTTITVPPGKVLKIEGASISEISPPIVRPVYSSYAALTIANVNVFYAYSNQNTCLPLWLGAGTYDIEAAQVNQGSGNYRIGISAIEFNVVP